MTQELLTGWSETEWSDLVCEIIKCVFRRNIKNFFNYHAF